MTGRSTNSSQTKKLLIVVLQVSGRLGFCFGLDRMLSNCDMEYVLIEVNSYNFRQKTNTHEILDYVVSMAELARLNNITPILTTVIPPGKEALNIMKTQDNFGDYMKLDSLWLYDFWIMSYAAENSYRYIDFNGLLSDNDGILKDQYSEGLMGLNSEGYHLISKALLKSIEVPHTSFE